MLYYMPQIAYHERQSLLSLDLHPVSIDGVYRMVTTSAQKEVRIWRVEFEKTDSATPGIKIDFAANLTNGHACTVNQVKFCQNIFNNMLASADVNGTICIWTLTNLPVTTKPFDGFPQDLERWIRYKTFFHELEVNSIAWSPCGRHIASVSVDTTLRVHDTFTGKRCFVVALNRVFPNGVTYDPLGRYIIVMSTDRTMDVICANDGSRLQSFGALMLPEMTLNSVEFQHKYYQLFHDDMLTTFQRKCDFSPCGQILVVPAGCIKTSNKDKFYCTYIFHCNSLTKDAEKRKPLAILPSNNPSFLIKFCPLILDLLPDEVNYTGLPKRVVWLTVTREEIIIYDSQHPRAIGYITGLTYKCISDVSWSQDGEFIIVADQEEYVHYFRVDFDELCLISDHSW